MPYIATNDIGPPRPPGHVAAGQRLKHGTINQIIDSIVGARQIRRQRLRFIAHGRVYRGPFNGRLNTNGTSIDVSDGLVSLGKTRRRFAIGDTTESTAFANVSFVAFTSTTAFIVCRARPLSLATPGIKEIQIDFIATDKPPPDLSVPSGLGFVDIYIGKVVTDSFGVARSYEQIQKDNFSQDFYDGAFAGFILAGATPSSIRVDRGLIYKGTAAPEDGRGLTFTISIPSVAQTSFVFLLLQEGVATSAFDQVAIPTQGASDIKIVIGEVTHDGTKITKWLQRWDAGDIYVPRHCGAGTLLVVSLDAVCPP